MSATDLTPQLLTQQETQPEEPSVPQQDSAPVAASRFRPAPPGDPISPPCSRPAPAQPAGDGSGAPTSGTATPDTAHLPMSTESNALSEEGVVHLPCSGPALQLQSQPGRHTCIGQAPVSAPSGRSAPGERRGPPGSGSAPPKRSHVPPTAPYALAETLADLLHLAARLLRPGGRLVFFIPSLPSPEPAFLPSHPCLRLVADSEQVRFD